MFLSIVCWILAAVPGVAGIAYILRYDHGPHRWRSMSWPASLLMSSCGVFVSLGLWFNHSAIAPDWLIGSGLQLARTAWQHSDFAGAPDGPVPPAPVAPVVTQPEVVALPSGPVLPHSRGSEFDAPTELVDSTWRVPH